MPKTKKSLFEYFHIIPDFRVDRTKRYCLIDIIIIAVCAVVCGADSWNGIEWFGESKEEWFKSFLELPNGIPSHDTFARVLMFIDPRIFEQCFREWVDAMRELLPKEVVAIDGKTIRRSHDRKNGLGPLHLVSAFAAENGLTLGEYAVDGKSNEITAIPKLLETLRIKGCIVTIDAVGCQKEIVTKILEKQADYVIAVKRNQPTLFQDIETLFAARAPTGLDRASLEERSHGRFESRECSVICGSDALSGLTTKDAWKGLSCIAKITSTRIIKRKTTTDCRYYISSVKEPRADELLNAIRDHWKIENSLHWTLDVTFHEDGSRIRAGHAQENFALMRKISLNLLKQDTSKKASIRGKRKIAGWDKPYLLKVLGI